MPRNWPLVCAVYGYRLEHLQFSLSAVCGYRWKHTVYAQKLTSCIYYVLLQIELVKIMPINWLRLFAVCGYSSGTFNFLVSAVCYYRFDYLQFMLRNWHLSAVCSYRLEHIQMMLRNLWLVNSVYCNKLSACSATSVYVVCVRACVCVCNVCQREREIKCYT